MIVDESPVTNEEQETNTEEVDNSVSTSGEEFSCLYAKYTGYVYPSLIYMRGKGIIHYCPLAGRYTSLVYRRAWV